MSDKSITRCKVCVDLGAENLVWLQDAAKSKKMSFSAAMDTLVTIFRKMKHYELTDEQADRVRQIVEENYQKRLAQKIRRAEKNLEQLKSQVK